jgi:hypothetical protein
MKLSRIFSALALATRIAATSNIVEVALSTTFNGDEVPPMRNLTAEDIPDAISEGNW